ncbi:hypothetical protein TWF481_008760 [Arthrobotrys musiformis]|uniref:Inhibitor I9 domain-containing protein n=1 Tax=Arthrobotrys musiformis TaxID=47236 RepID=A0AAV9W854_9PEZI
MKPATFFSTLLLLASALAAPAPQAPTKTTSIAASPTAAVSDYIIVMNDTEKRPWSEIFAEMSEKWPEIKAFKTNETHPFGDSLRAFTVEVTEEEAGEIESMENVVSVEKNGEVKMVGRL